MKTVLHLHALSFFLLAFTTGTLAVADVLDTDGEPVQNAGGSYYILPAFRGMGGGLELAKTGKETCPLTVVQARSELSLGLPARFSSPLLILYISTNMHLNIQFVTEERCLPQPSLWDVVKESTIERKSVKIAEFAGQWLGGPFKVQTHGSDYKLVYCSSDDSREDCKDLGISIDKEGNRRLVVRDGHPLIVVFKKAEEHQSAGMSIV